MEPTAQVKQGRASSVSDLGDGTILRVGGNPQREALIMELALSHDFAVPRIHEVRPDALVLQRIAGPTMGRAMVRSPWVIGRHVRTLAELHERLHAIPFDGGSLLHFDLHPENVILSPDGPVVIDWTNAHGGDPDTDVAMTWVILETSAGLLGRLLARLFRRTVGYQAINRGLTEARAYRLRDSNVKGREKERVARL